MKTVLLVGGTGNLGALIGRELLKRGARLRLLVRPGRRSKVPADLARAAEIVEDEQTAFQDVFTVVSAVQGGPETIVDAQLRFLLLDTSRPAVLVAGGIGITPLKGMAEYAADRKLPIPVRLVYSNRTVEEIVYREELEALERRNPNFHALFTLTRPGPDSWKARTGRIGDQVGPNLLAEAAEGLDRPVYYLCGTQSFVEASFRSLVNSGVPEADTRFEVFRGYGAAA